MRLGQLQLAELEATADTSHERHAATIGDQPARRQLELIRTPAPDDRWFAVDEHLDPVHTNAANDFGNMADFQCIVAGREFVGRTQFPI